ncbi:hypothetical protein B0T26DRAFT_387838 [Lasiosphaeria miniovina]|uniref:Uncharacterized protein n=1 Tax=Lasiosphaeria miniovina TaxID=1954250 RepID=A0AA40DPY8_9PEZI|nr:uncharacterized protein B0T26DRAFT_387838 [Lasiosphaeria miniovina]KAK0708952.1 hypothetical protein B0T26DRAFT_387838 [Lasiosphaeria miniovina]
MKNERKFSAERKKKGGTWEAGCRAAGGCSEATRVFGPNVEKMNIDRIGQTLIPRLIFHEMMHSVCYGLNDHDTDGMGMAGWQYCMKLKKGAGATGAESLAYFRLWAAASPCTAAGTTQGPSHWEQYVLYAQCQARN